MKQCSKLLLLPLAFALVGCGNGGDDGGGGGSITLKDALAVDGVQGFLLGGAPAGGASNGTRSFGARSLRALAEGDPAPGAARLYAIGADGSLTETTVVEGGEPTDTRYVPHVMADSPKYVLFGFEFLVVTTADGNRDCGLLLLRKSDGALFCAPGVSGFSGQVQAGADGDLIYVNSPQTLYRIDATDPAALSIESLIEPLSTPEAGVRTWIANADGDLFVSFGGDDQLRVYKAEGGLQNVANAAEDCMTRGLAGEPGGYYYSINTPPDGIFVHRLARQADGDFGDESVGVDASPPYTGCETALVTSDRIYVRPTGHEAPNELVEFVNPDMSFVRHEIAALTELERAVGQGSYIFVLGDDELGNGGIVRFDTTDDSQVTVVPPGDFTLSAIDLSESGDLTFTGMRNSDGRLIVGNVAAGSDAYDVVSESAPQSAAVVRIQ